MEAAFICSQELWSRGFGQGHPLTPERLKPTYDLLTAYRAFDTPTWHPVEPRPATREELLLFHTAEYVDAVERLSAALSQSKGNVLSLPEEHGEGRTLAYGVMSSHSFPDELSPAYAERYSPGRLHDAERPVPVEEPVARQTHAYVEKGIALLKARTEDVWQWEEEAYGWSASTGRIRRSPLARAEGRTEQSRVVKPVLSLPRRDPRRAVG